MGEPAIDMDVALSMLEDYEFYAEQTLQVLNKEGQRVPFVFNRIQKKLDEVVQEQLDRRGYVRLLIGKGRQQGASLWVEGRGYKQTTQNPGWRTLIIAHEADATKKLFGYVKRFHKHNPFPPHTSNSNAQELVFDKMDASYRLLTAGSPEAGRSETCQFFHGSEVAFWNNGAEILKGAFQALTTSPGSEGYLESTANGRSGKFWELWDLAMKAERGDIDPATGQPYVAEWERLFLPWFWQDEYRSPVPPGFQRTKKEDLLAKKFGLDDAQLQWRRAKISEFGGGEEGELSFRQEYPCTELEMFILSGRKFFSVARVERMVLTAREPLERGRLEQAGHEVRFVPDDEGWLEVWARPVKGLHYAVGGDVSEGTVKGDQHSGQVLLRGHVARQVARAAPHVDADEWGRRLVLMAKWYRNAWLGIERNGLGLATVKAAQATQYEKLYRGEEVDSDSGRVLKKVGWITTTTSRRTMTQDLQAGIRDGSVYVESSVTAGQCETFIVNDNGKCEAADGARDDEVLGLAIAYQVLKTTEPDDAGLDISGTRSESGPPATIKVTQDWA